MKRLKSGTGNGVFTVKKRDDINGPVPSYCLLRGEIYELRLRQYAPFAVILSPSPFAGRRIDMRIGSHSTGSWVQARYPHLRKLKTVTSGNEPMRGNP